MKTCRECGTKLDDTNKVPGKNLCKLCKSVYNNRYYSDNRDRLIHSMRRYYRGNLQKFSSYSRTYRDNNQERLRQYNADYQRKRRSSDPQYRLRHNLSRLITQALRRRGYGKNSKTFNILGADKDTVEAHLIHTAIANYGKYFPARRYHIDHITPCATARNEHELIRLQHYTNLQLLYPADNLRKRDYAGEWVPIFGR